VPVLGATAACGRVPEWSPPADGIAPAPAIEVAPPRPAKLRVGGSCDQQQDHDDLDFLAGVAAAFAAANAASGAGSPQLELLVLDQANGLEGLAANVRHLIANEQVVALVGGSGSGCAEVTLPLAVAGTVPLWAPCSGASAVHRAPATAFPLRASVREQLAFVFGGLAAAGVPLDRVAVAVERGALGEEILATAARELAANGVQSPRTLQLRLDAAMPQAASCLLDVEATGVRPAVVVIAASVAPCAELLRTLRAGLRVPVVCTAALVPEDLAEHAGADADSAGVVAVLAASSGAEVAGWLSPASKASICAATREGFVAGRELATMLLALPKDCDLAVQRRRLRDAMVARCSSGAARADFQLGLLRLSRGQPELRQCARNKSSNLRDS